MGTCPTSKSTKDKRLLSCPNCLVLALHAYRTAQAIRPVMLLNTRCATPPASTPKCALERRQQAVRGLVKLET
jgi:hypothetical protein